MKIQMVDVKRQYNTLKVEFDQAVISVLESGMFINGPEVKSFAKEMETYLKVQHAVPCASGTDALQLALMALDIGPGDEVITSPFTFFATAEVIELVGATTVFIDIEPKGYNLDVSLLERAITPKTKAIIPVHLYGQAADMDEINAIARKHNIPVIEDAAQAVGAEYKGKKLCGLGAFGCISYFPSKNLGAFGDGGMITTNDDQMAEKLDSLVNHGSKVRYIHDRVGLNSRLDSIQAAILRVKLKYLDQWNGRRQQAAAAYGERLQPLGISTPAILNNRTHIFHQYTVRVKNRDGLSAYLNEKGIPHGVYYPIPLHLQTPFKEKFGYREGAFPVSEEAAREVISFPMHPDLTVEEIDFITGHVKQFYMK